MTRKKDLLISVIEQSLDCGRFIPYGAAWDFVDELESTKSQVDNLVERGEAQRAVGLYELFMAGCYEKMDEIDDSSGNMGTFFEELFCSWISARQKAGLEPEETVNQMLKMMENDDYGLCYNIEKEVVKVLNKKEMSLFEKNIYSRFEKSLSLEKSTKREMINDFSYAVRKNADILKIIYTTKKDLESYLNLCDKIGTTPKDCEAIVNIYKSKRQWEKAIYFVNKGLSLEKERNWPNQSSYHLSGLKREILIKLGNNDEALKTAWEDFKEGPAEYSYEELMKYVPKKETKQWHGKAIIEAKKGALSTFIRICVLTKELDILAEHLLNVKHNELEGLSHYTTEDAARKLSKKHYAAAAKIYRALCIRILNSKKSKYYHHALDHLEKAKKLYQKSDLEKEWTSTVDTIRKDHFRKYSFMGDFEEIVKKGTLSRKYPSFKKKHRSDGKNRFHRYK